LTRATLSLWNTTEDIPASLPHVRRKIPTTPQLKKEKGYGTGEITTELEIQILRPLPKQKRIAYTRVCWGLADERF